MKFVDISHDTKNQYVLAQNEERVFFLWNRSGELVFELKGKRAKAHIFAFFSLNHEEKRLLHITQHHQAPETTSTVTVKSALDNQAECSYEGIVRIDSSALLADASQESRTLLLSPHTKAMSKPTLEILQNDVRCHHAATVSPVNQEALFFSESRGLSKSQAEKLLVQGFFKSTLEKMSTLISSQEQEKMLALVGKYFASPSL